MINNSDFGGFIVSNNILEGKPIRYTFRDQSIIPPLNGWNLLSIEMMKSIFQMQPISKF